MNTRPGALLCGVLIALSLTGHHAAAAGKVSPRTVELIDVYPTIAEMRALLHRRM